MQNVDKQLKIKVFGKVQGVWFRKSVLDKAVSLNLKGVVMNEEDGTVFIIAKGEQEKLDELISFCRIGPKHADVLNLHIEEDEITDFKDFKIL